MKEKIKRNVIKIGMLGDSRVGKTAICNTFMNIEFMDNTLSTIGMEKLESQMTLKNGEEIKLVIWDTAGQERFHSLALKTIRTVQGVVVVFDFTCRKSFENITNWLNEVKENLNETTIVLFGNKCDIEEELWEVSREAAIEFAKEKNLPLFETSAKLNKGIKEGFESITNLAYEKYEGNANTGIQLKKEEEPEEQKKQKSKCCGGGKESKKSEGETKK
jgi:small GTP-binding protein